MIGNRMGKKATEKHCDRRCCADDDGHRCGEDYLTEYKRLDIGRLVFCCLPAWREPQNTAPPSPLAVSARRVKCSLNAFPAHLLCSSIAAVFFANHRSLERGAIVISTPRRAFRSLGCLHRLVKDDELSEEGRQ